MGWKTVLVIFITLIVVALLLIYFFVPFNTIEFNTTSSTNSNFSLNIGYDNLQFYENMRYRKKEISYKIYDACSLKKKNDMEQALEIIEGLTILDFYPVDYGEEISVTCKDEVVYEGGMFVGGEGGVTNVTISGDFNVIYNGKVLLIRDSDCANPNIAIHELLHALGFDHSENKNNIMYAVSDCKQTIGHDIPEFLNEIYSIEQYPDLLIEDVDAIMHGKYLDANLTIRNNGLKYSGESKLIISADGKKVDEEDLAPFELGYGSRISFTNLWIGQINIDEIEFFIYNTFSELDKDNNRVVLELKNK